MAPDDRRDESPRGPAGPARGAAPDPPPAEPPAPSALGWLREVLADRYTFLLISLLALMTTLPFVRPGADAAPESRVIDLIFVAILLSSLRAVWRHKAVVVAGAVLALGVLASPDWLPLPDTPLWWHVHHASSVLFLGLICASILTTLARTVRVRMDTIWGACCVYLLLGLMWAELYAMVEVALPGSFHWPAVPPGMRMSLDGELLYFSFSTLTTLGFGDIVPLSPPARVLSSAEVVVGQLFIAIMIARLVGLYVALHFVHRMKAEED